MTDPELRIQITAPATPVLVDGPIPVTVEITNTSARPVHVDLAYPNLLFLRFTSPAATPWPVPVPPSVIGALTAIAPGGHLQSTYYLNRYLRFGGPGSAQVSYQLVVPVTRDDGGGDVAARGELTYTLVAGSDDLLREALSDVAVGLRSKDPKTQREAAEALAFLETPRAIEYQARMLNIPPLEPIGIAALGRSPSPAARALVVEMLGKGDSSVRGAAFDVLDGMGAAMPREKVVRKLTSDDAAAREDARALLQKHPDPGDRALVTRLLDDPAPAVRERAKAFLDALPK